MVFGDGIGDVFQQDRFTRFGLRYNHSTLAFPNGGEQIQNAG